MPSEDEITAELPSVETRPPSQDNLRASAWVKVTLGMKTDLGRVRENNEDKGDWLEPEDPKVVANRGYLYAVADGMGGHSAGQIASELALKTLFRTYYASTEGPPDQALLLAFHTANEIVYQSAQQIPGREGMGTTLVALALVGNRGWICNVGDSRAYRLREGRIEQLSEDHSWVAEQVRRGGLTPEEALLSPYRNVLSQAIGATPKVDPFLSEVELQPDDRFLLCSDGLTSVVTDEEILSIVQKEAPSVACSLLIDLANERGGPDNITVLIVRIDQVEPWDEETAKTPSSSLETLEEAGKKPVPTKEPFKRWFWKRKRT